MLCKHPVKDSDGMVSAVQDRERKLQHKLIEKIERYIHGETDEFAFASLSEAERLSKAAFGKDFLHTIG